MSIKKTILIVAASALALAACSQVKPGYVGIKVNQYGSGAGVDPHPVGVGAYFVPFGTTIEEYKVSTSTYVWSASAQEGSSGDESIHFQDKSGLDLSADVGAMFHVDQQLAPALYQKFRTDEDGLIRQLRSAVRNALVARAANMPVEDIYGPGKTELIHKTLEDVQAQFKPLGLDVEQLYWASGVRVPPTIMAQIAARVANENAALAAQANVATATANANAQREAARGKADAMALEAAALRSNPEMAQLRAIEKWNGELPTYTGSGPLPFLAVK